VRHVARSHGGDARFLPGVGSVVVALPALTPAGARDQNTAADA
jgi:hypothetical protein